MNGKIDKRGEAFDEVFWVKIICQKLLIIYKQIRHASFFSSTEGEFSDKPSFMYRTENIQSNDAVYARRYITRIKYPECPRGYFSMEIFIHNMVKYYVRKYVKYYVKDINAARGLRK